MMFAVLLVLLTWSLDACTTATNLAWWQKATIYQIYPRSFKDSDGDGVGDLQGIKEKMGYLSSLGIDAFWLSPIFPSPMADFGYDVSHFTDVDRDYGTLEDFDELLAAAHEKGLRLILDFVPNHSSDQHQWFLASSDENSQDFEVFKDFYVWRPGREVNGRLLPPNNWVSAFGGSAWECDTKGRAGLCYLHQYSVHQPDLNYSNPHVLEAMKDVLRFWLDRGIDGVRMDAVRALHEDPLLRDNSVRKDGSLSSERTRNLPGSYEVVHHFRRVVDEYPGRVMISESYGTLDQVLGYCRRGRKLGAHLAFNFFLATHLDSNSTAEDFKKVIDSWVKAAADRGCWSNWVLGNHDLHRVATRFGSSMVDPLNMLVAVLPGTAFTYYGEELGLEDNVAISYEQGADPKGLQAGPRRFPKVSRDFQRTPFPWDGSINAGFSSSMSTWLPVNADYVSINVANQEFYFTSHLNVYKRLLAFRKEEQDVLQFGDLETEVLSKYVLYISRRHGSNLIKTLINLGPDVEHVNLGKAGDLPELVTVRVATGNSAIPEGYSSSRRLLVMAPFSGMVLSPFDSWLRDTPISGGTTLQGVCNAVTLSALLSYYVTCHS